MIVSTSAGLAFHRWPWLTLQLLGRVADLQKSVWKNNYGRSSMKNGARGTRRTVEQVRNKGQELLKNNPNYTETLEKSLAHINQPAVVLSGLLCSGSEQPPKPSRCLSPLWHL